MGVTVGVLLPIRIETRFAPGLLRLRVVPDEPWFARHDARVSMGELDALRGYLDALGTATTEPAREAAWQALATATGGARAVYLVRSFVVTAADGTTSVREPAPEDIRVDPPFPRIEGFPDTLHVWLARGGGAPVEALTLAIDQTRL